MTKHTTVGFALLLGACSAGAIDDQAVPSVPNAIAPPTRDQAMTSPAVVDPEPNLRQLASPLHSDAVPWGFPESADTLGSGPCAGVRLRDMVDVVRARVPELGDIRDLRLPGPQGFVPTTAGPAVPAGQAPPPATGTAGYVVGLMDQRSFGLVFFRGQSCRGEQCEVQERWYFETDQQCRPRWVGHFKTTERAGGRHGRCFDVEGASLWNEATPMSARDRCDADWSPQNISGTRAALSANPGSSCGRKDAFVPVSVTIGQGTDLAVATLVVSGTGIDFLDGKSLAGTVERQMLNGKVEEQVPGACPLRRTFSFSFDFELGTAYGLPGGFGILDVNEKADAGCTPAAAACSASLHFIKR